MYFKLVNGKKFGLIKLLSFLLTSKIHEKVAKRNGHLNEQVLGSPISLTTWSARSHREPRGLR